MSQRRPRRKLSAEATRKRQQSGDGRPLTRAGKARLRTIDDLDARTAAARRARELVADLEADLGGDLSSARRELIKRAALLGAIVEDHEVRWLQQEPVDLSLYGTLVDRQRRVLAELGLDRVPRDVTPSLDEYARQVSEEVSP